MGNGFLSIACDCAGRAGKRQDQPEKPHSKQYPFQTNAKIADLRRGAYQERESLIASFFAQVRG
jgi:hypothetical protein